jgi:NAD(P)-dependent dehydrogenase (short-subunit alcohol dehydrogenase family)
MGPSPRGPEIGGETRRMLFHDDVVLCAGATGRVGVFLLATLVREGAKIAVLSRTLEGAQRAIDEQLAAKDRSRALALAADLHDTERTAAAVEAARAHFGRIDALVNLAGDSAIGPLLTSTIGDLHKNVDGLLGTAYNISIPVLRVMIDQPFAPDALSRGHFVTVTAGSSIDPAPGRGLFGAAKSAVNTLMKAIAREHKADGIVANAVVLGGVATDVSRERRGEEAWNAAARPQEVADVLAFLASRRSSGINGALVDVNAREVD